MMSEAERIDLSQAAIFATNVSPNMDPRLQFHVACSRAGVVRPAATSTELDEIAVVARVSKTADWTALGEIREPVIIGAISNKEHIVTGRIPIRRLEQVRSQSFVKSLKAAQTVHPMLSATTDETGARPNQLPAGHQANGGAGIVVGVIDYGGDFAHENFLNGSGTTRILSLWFQDGPTTVTSPFGYGREFTAQVLNLALQQANPYQAIGYDPADFEDPFDPGAHGTHVMDIAAGNGRGTSVAGMAPNADLIFVNISHVKDPTGVDVVGKSFGDSVRMLEALKYIFDRAGAQPCVVNISLGTNAGPHDGTTLVEQGMDSLLNAAPNRAVTISASNSFDDGIHATGTVLANQTVDLSWQMQNLQRNIELEIWYTGADRFTVELITPNGVSLAMVAPGASQTLTAGNQVAVFIANRLNDPNNHDNMIGIFLSDGMPGGTYTVRLHGDQVTNGEFHAWIERDNFFQSRFLPPNDNTQTIGSISCSQKSIAVGSYDAHKVTRPLSVFSSAGPTRDNRQKARGLRSRTIRKSSAVEHRHRNSTDEWHEYGLTCSRGVDCPDDGRGPRTRHRSDGGPNP